MMSLPNENSRSLSRRINCALKLLGYPINGDGGLCYGVAHMAMQAILADDLESFIQRCHLIDYIDQKAQAQPSILELPSDTGADAEEKSMKLAAQKEFVKLAIKNFISIATQSATEETAYATKQWLTAYLEELDNYPTLNNFKFAGEENEKLIHYLFIDLMAFLDGIVLYQETAQFEKFIPSTITNDLALSKLKVQDATRVTPVTYPYYLEQNSKIITCQDNILGRYTVTTLSESLERLHNLIKTEQRSIALVLEDGNHVVTLGYYPLKSMWVFIDSNALSVQYYSVKNNVRQFAQDIIHSFPLVLKYTSDEAILSSAIYILSNENINTETLQTYQLNIPLTWQCKKTINYHYSGLLYTPLVYIAIKENDFSQLEQLATQCAADINVPSIPVSGNKLSALQYAVLVERKDMVHLLLKQGATVYSTDSNGQTPLYSAIKYGSIDIAQCLIEYGADINQCAANKISPLLLAIYLGYLDDIMQSPSEKLSEQLKNQLNSLNLETPITIEQASSLSKLGIIRTKYSDDQITKQKTFLLNRKPPFPLGDLANICKAQRLIDHFYRRHLNDISWLIKRRSFKLPPLGGTFFDGKKYPNGAARTLTTLQEAIPNNPDHLITTTAYHELNNKIETILSPKTNASKFSSLVTRRDVGTANFYNSILFQMKKYTYLPSDTNNNSQSTPSTSHFTKNPPISPAKPQK